MTHEQKPESAEFLPIGEQAVSFSHWVRDEGDDFHKVLARVGHELRIAEARGAVEQRRKDAEGVQAPDEGPFLIVFQEDGVKPELFAGSGAKKGAYDRFEMVSAGYHCRLYAAVASSMKHDHDNGALLRVANVAALEARVKELEGALFSTKEGVRKAASSVMGIQTEAMGGDNIAITLCSYFEDLIGEHDPNGWHPEAQKACDEIEAAIVAHIDAAIREGGEHG